MTFSEKTVTLKSGKTAILRSPQKEDAEGMLNAIKTASGETDFLMRYPEEWTISIEQEERWIQSLLASQSSVCIACFVDGKVAGSCQIDFHTPIKEAHRATVGIALLREFWNDGIGSHLFSEMIALAKERGTSILELAFFEGNDRARALYEKFGFRVFAERPNAFRLKDGSFKKEFLMQKYL